MPIRKKKTANKNVKAKGKSFIKEENSIATYFKNSLEMQNESKEDDRSSQDAKENFIIIPDEKTSIGQLSDQKSCDTNNHIQRSLSVPPHRTRKNKAPTELNTDQPKISDFFPVRRSKRTSAQEIKKREKEELERMILDRTRELGEDHLEVIQIIGKGRGVVAKRSYQRGEFVVEYAGDLIEHSIAKQRESQYKLSPSYGCYMYYFNSGNKQYCIDATEETNRLGRLVNHSRLKPNCATKVVDINGTPRLVLVAIKVVEPGEEVLYDYGDRNKESLVAHPWLAV